MDVTETTGDPRLDKALRDRISEFETHWNQLPLSVREGYALDIGHLRLLQRLAEQYIAQGHPAAEHLRAAAVAMQQRTEESA